MVKMYFFGKIGIRIGQKILDFGCGKGNYTIPLARAIGSGGMVYALDKDKEVLEKLQKRIYIEELGNIKIIHSADKLKIPIGNNVLDVVFLYDVIHSYYFTESERVKLLSEANRVLKVGGLLSVYPKHIEPDYVKEAVCKHNFLLEAELRETLVHDDQPVEDTIINFRKIKESQGAIYG